jgi:ribosomal-protein-alanine N-acetyltransferase
LAAVLTPECSLRPMRRGDVSAVHAIECDAYPHPWSRSIFADCLRVGYCCRVADVDGRVGAYSILSAAAGESHLLNLCVARTHRRIGLGQMMLEGITVDARLLGAHRLFLEVRPSNAAAIALYQASGFRVIGRRPDYYPRGSGREDALVMVRHLDDNDD